MRTVLYTNDADIMHVGRMSNPHHEAIGSPGPFVFQARSYISLTLLDTSAKRQASTRGSVWVWSVPLSSGGTSVQTRVDGDLGVHPIDPETYVTADVAFVYHYHMINESQPDERVELRRYVFAP